MCAADHANRDSATCFGHKQEKVESLTSGQCSMEYHEWVVMLIFVPMRSHNEMDTPLLFFIISHA
jgi:hypothetical protein